MILFFPIPGAFLYGICHGMGRFQRRMIPLVFAQYAKGGKQPLRPSHRCSVRVRRHTTDECSGPNSTIVQVRPIYRMRVCEICPFFVLEYVRQRSVQNAFPGILRWRQARRMLFRGQALAARPRRR